MSVLVLNLNVEGNTWERLGGDRALGRGFARALRELGRGFEEELMQLG